MKLTWIWRSDSGLTYQIGSHRVTPLFRTIGLRWRRGAWLWQFPVAVYLQDERNRAQQRVPIPDPTRASIWLMMSITLVAFASLILIRPNQNK